MQLTRENGAYQIDRNPAMAGFITPNAHEKSEWSRMAQAAYLGRRNDIGHRFSVAASLPSYGQVTVAYFDRLQTEYRAWLISDEWPAV